MCFSHFYEDKKMTTVTIQAWSEEDKTTSDFEIGLDTLLMLGCENNPVIEVGNWMKMQEIEGLQAFADYVNNLDFNVEVVG